MIEVKISKIKTKRKKELYSVAIVSTITVGGKTKRMIAYQGRYKTKKAAITRRDELLKVVKDKVGA